MLVVIDLLEIHIKSSINSSAQLIHLLTNLKMTEEISSDLCLEMLLEVKTNFKFLNQQILRLILNVHSMNSTTAVLRELNSIVMYLPTMARQQNHKEKRWTLKLNQASLRLQFSLSQAKAMKLMPRKLADLWLDSSRFNMIITEERTMTWSILAPSLLSKLYSLTQSAW